MHRYPVSVCANLISWPSISAGLALGAAWGVTLAVCLGLLVARLTAR